MLKSIFRWVKVIIKILLLIICTPFILLYFWLKISIYRFVVKHEFRKYKLSKHQIKSLMSGAMKLSDGLVFLKN